MQKQFSISEAKNRLPTIIHYVEKGPYIELTRRGKPVAVLLSIEEYERLSRKYTGFWNALSEFRRKVEDEGIEIFDTDFNGLRDLSSGFYTLVSKGTDEQNFLRRLFAKRKHFDEVPSNRLEVETLKDFPPVDDVVQRVGHGCFSLSPFS